MTPVVTTVANDPNPAALLDVRNLNVTYPASGGDVHAVRGVDLTLQAGQMLGMAGESGSGKTTFGLSLLRLTPRGARIRGDIRFKGEDLTTANWSRMRTVRWSQASVVFQGAMSALNPVRSIGEQICEPILLHEKVSRSAARQRTRSLLDDVGVPASRQSSYPHELSGGQRQRVMIAMALACRPDLIIADEPTTALDVVVQTQILTLLRDLVQQSRISLIMISHDLSVLGASCDRLAIMYAGRIVEIGPSTNLTTHPQHPYTSALSQAFPTIGDPTSRMAPEGIPGDPPDLRSIPDGCPFAPRCSEVMDECHSRDVQLWPAGPNDHRSACLKALPNLKRPSSDPSMIEE